MDFDQDGPLLAASSPIQGDPSMSLATHLLLTTDFSEAADEAVTKAGVLAREFGIKLTILHVHRRPPAAPEAVIPAGKVVSSADLEKDALQALEALKNDRFADIEGVEIDTVEHGSAPLAIVDYAAKHGVDLIVIGTHGRTGMGRLLIGSVAEKVVRHATCAVLVVPHKTPL
jgi:nucleotide-binding universal stress UspA family protein